MPALAVGIPFGLELAEGHPRINDVSTDRKNPPVSATLKKDYSESVAERVLKAHPWLAPLPTPLSPKELFRLAVRIAERHDDWTITLVDGLRFSGVATSRLFKFKDDFVVRIRQNETGSVLDMRSASRDGENDYGVNAERIENYLEAVRKETAPLIR